LSTAKVITGSFEPHAPIVAGKGRPIDIAKREAIISAASDAFFESGYAASSIEQIAISAGVSKVTIYNHFGDKRALFMVAVERKCEHIRGLFSIEPMEPGENIGDRLLKIGERITVFLALPEIVQFERRIAAETEHNSEIGRVFLRAGPWKVRDAFSSMLIHACERGELSIANPVLAAEQFVSMCKGMGDVEGRFGVISDPKEITLRVKKAVSVFLLAYGSKTGS